MNYKLACCDDSIAARNQIQSFFSRLGAETGDIYSVSYFRSADELLLNMSRDTQILLLDIGMEGMSGMALARHLREQNNDIYIIFITSMVQYAIEGYEVRAFGFLEKPLSYALFRREILDVTADITGKGDHIVSLNIGDTLSVLHSNKLLFAEVYGHIVQLTCTDEVRQCAISLSALEEKLTGASFFRCHKSYLVNYRHIADIGLTEITLSNGAVIPLSRHRRKSLLTGFANYISNAGPSGVR